MKKISTVLGEISSEELGKTLVHEHVACVWVGWELDRHAPFHKREVVESRLNMVAEQFIKLKEVHGVKTIIDASPANFGRNTDWLCRVSERTGLNIIAATGLYREVTVLQPYFHDLSVDGITNWMIGELTEGMGLSDVKAGVIKVATGPSIITESDEKTIRAAARAQKETGAPILTHTSEGTMGPEQADILKKEGADLSKVIIGHSGYNSDIRYHLELLHRGVFIGYDQIGMTAFSDKTGTLTYLPQIDDIRLMLITGLITAGYVNQVMMSMDICGFFPGREGNPYILRDPTPYTLPNRSFLYLFEEFIPRLIKGGVSQEAIETMLVTNPRRLFEGASWDSPDG